jgi:hypothetical protein
VDVLLIPTAQEVLVCSRQPCETLAPRFGHVSPGGDDETAVTVAIISPAAGQADPQIPACSRVDLIFAEVMLGSDPLRIEDAVYRLAPS